MPKLFKPKAIDLFCGAGGLSLGLEKAGFEITLAVDNDVRSLETYQRNLGHKTLHGDLTRLKPKNVRRELGLGQIDLIAGGPPCQGFSIQRRGSDVDERNDLLLRFLDWVVEIQPRYFLIENVSGLRGRRGRPYLERLIQRARQAGYVCQYELLNAADYGIPQIRKRMVIVGERTASPKPSFQFPQPTHTIGNYRTVRDAIADLPHPPEDGSEHSAWPNHRADRLSPKNRERFKFVPEGGGRADIPAKYRLKCHSVDPDKAGHRYVYGRLAWNKPASTITARFDSLTRGRFGHPSQTRSISLREGARLQSFPDTHVFVGTKVEVTRQIGNAVPPQLAFVLGKGILCALRNREDLPIRSAALQQREKRMAVI